MKQCTKCGGDSVSTKFRPEGSKVYWEEHNQIEDISKFTRNDRYYTADKIDTECLVHKCKTCGFKKASPTLKNI